MNPKSSIKKITRRFGVRRYSSVELLGALILLIAAMPFVDDLPHGATVESALLSLVMISAGLAVGGRRNVLLLALLLLLPALITRWTHHLFPHLVSPTVHLVFCLIFIAFVVANILRFILRATRVDTEVICAAISVYLMIGMLWGFAYMLVGICSNEAFYFAPIWNDARTMTPFNSFYFSFTTLSSVGFGDITPSSKVARMLAVMETITGILYIAVLISRLVSLYTPIGHRSPFKDSNPP